jgi:formyl-CoA transferase
MPLSGLKVIDLCRARAGPTAVRQLADWGADVIKIERPPALGDETLGGDRHGFDFLNLHRNKRSLTLNLKAARGRELFLELARGADVIVENFRPDVKHRLGIDYDTVAALNPRIVYGSISGFGQEGPYSKRPGLDQIAQGLSGFMSVTGLPGQGPVRAGVPMADLSAGYHLALAIMMALFEREKSGRGQWVHTSLLEAQLAMMDFQAARYLIANDVPKQAGNNHPTAIPTGVFETRDGRINIQAASDHLYVRLCKALGTDELIDDTRFTGQQERSQNRDLLHEILGEHIRQRSSAEMIDLLAEAGVPCGPIYTVDQTFADPQVQSLKMDPQFRHTTLGPMRLLGQSINMSRTPEHVDRATPELGEHSDEIMRELGYSDEQIGALRSERII